jgi:hypothetical protein
MGTITGRYTPAMTGRRRDGRVVPITHVAVAVRRARAFELAVSGKNPVEIAEELQVTPSTASMYVTEALAMLPPPDVEEARRLEVARLDAMLQALWPQIKHGNPDAVRAAIPVTQERMKIIGGYAASRVDAVVTVQTEADRALVELLKQAEAEMTRREAQILDADVVEGGEAG